MGFIFAGNLENEADADEYADCMKSPTCPLAGASMIVYSWLVLVPICVMVVLSSLC
jgi:hypothetical protein